MKRTVGHALTGLGLAVFCWGCFRVEWQEALGGVAWIVLGCLLMAAGQRLGGNLNWL